MDPEKVPMEKVQEKGQETKVSIESDADEPQVVGWFPGVKQRFPWVGLAGFIGVFICMGAAIAILETSHKKRAEVWPIKKRTIQPNVLINLVNQVSTLCLVTAIGQGLAIAWWRKALRGGTVKSLHRNHSYGYSLISVITSGKHFNTIALAALMTKFAIIDSTLFQKATSTQSDYLTNYKTQDVRVWVNSTWLPNQGGIPGISGEVEAVDYLIGDTLDALDQKIGNGKLHDTLAYFYGCPQGQTCTGTLRAPGFEFDCDITVENVTHGGFLDQQNAANSSTLNGTTQVYSLWNVDFDTIWPTPEKPSTSINVVMNYVNTLDNPGRKSCSGTYTRRTCRISPAIVEYPIEIQQAPEKGSIKVSHIGFSHPEKSPFNADLKGRKQIDGLKVIEPMPLSEHRGSPSLIAGLVFAFNNMYASSANLTWQNGWHLSLNGDYAQSTLTSWGASTSEHCEFKTDYTEDFDGVTNGEPFFVLLRNINTFGFIYSLYGNKNSWDWPDEITERSLDSSVVFKTDVSGFMQVYKTNRKFVAGAVVATFVTLLCVLPVYWGFWQLGRKVSLAPFEIASAFNAPMLSPESKKVQDIDQLMTEVGKRRVQYGQLIDGDRGTMGIAEPHKVLRPQGGMNSRLSTADLSGQVGLGVALGAAVAAIPVSK